MADNVDTFGDGWRQVRRRYPTPIGSVDLLCRDPHLTPVRGVFAAQEIKLQPPIRASDRGITCITVDYDALRRVDDPSGQLFCAEPGDVPIVERDVLMRLYSLDHGQTGT